MTIEENIRESLLNYVSPEFPVKTLEHLYHLNLSGYLNLGKYTQQECRDKALEDVIDTIKQYGRSG